MDAKRMLAGLALVVVVTAAAPRLVPAAAGRTVKVPPAVTQAKGSPVAKAGPRGGPVAVDRVAVFRRAAAKARPTAAQLAEAEAKLRSLPVAGQDALLSAVDAPHAAMVLPAALPQVTTFQLPTFPPLGPGVQLPPAITALHPDEGSRGAWLAVEGTLLNAACAVYLRGVRLPTVCVLNMLVFQVPQDAPRTLNPLYVKDEVRNTVSATVNLRVANERGYRGVHGFGFSNFATPTIPWSVFRNYFGASEVEYPNGMQRPAARAWYDAHYKGVAAGGNCYGMAMRAVRARLHDWRGTQSAWWEANQKPRVWDYPSVAPVLESITWDQAGQLSSQAAILKTARTLNQTNLQAFAFVKAALATGQPQKQPIVCVWKPDGGHAMVAYATEEAGTERRIFVWDSNLPYVTGENCPPKSPAVVDSDAGTFQYQGFTTLKAYTFEELNPSDPNLPSSAWPGKSVPEANLGVVVVDDPTALVEVADAQGRWLFRNGVDNRDPSTRIPNAWRFVPAGGTTAGPGRPAVFLFGSARGTTYDVRLRQDRAATVRSFATGMVTEVVGARGRVRLSRMLEADQGVELPEPALSRPTSLKLIALDGDGAERVFDVTPEGVLPDAPVSLKLDPSRKGLVVKNGSGKPLDVRLGLTGYSKSGLVSRKSLPLSRVPAGKTGALTAPDFGRLESLTQDSFKVLQGE